MKATPLVMWIAVLFFNAFTAQSIAPAQSTAATPAPFPFAERLAQHVGKWVVHFRKGVTIYEISPNGDIIYVQHNGEKGSGVLTPKDDFWRVDFQKESDLLQFGESDTIEVKKWRPKQNLDEGFPPDADGKGQRADTVAQRDPNASGANESRSKTPPASISPNMQPAVLPVTLEGDIAKLAGKWIVRYGKNIAIYDISTDGNITSYWRNGKQSSGTMKLRQDGCWGVDLGKEGYVFRFGQDGSVHVDKWNLRQNVDRGFSPDLSGEGQRDINEGGRN